MIHKNILFANLLQNTKELKLNIPWKKFGSQKDPLLYAKAETDYFMFIADISYVNDVPYYGYNCFIKPIRTQVLPNTFEEQETFFEGGFHKCQKEGLKFFVKLQKILQEYQVL